MKKSVFTLLAMLALAGCGASASFSEPQLSIRTTAALPMDDRAPILVATGSFANQREMPSFAQELLLNRRAEVTIGAAVLTPRALYLLAWTPRDEGFVTRVRLPLSAIVSVQFERFGLGSHMAVETREPMFTRLGALETTGLFHFTMSSPASARVDNDGTAALAEAVRHAATTAGAGLR